MVMWMLLLFGVLIIFFSYRHNRHLIDLSHEERMNALERGLEIPPFATPGTIPDRSVRAGHYLQRGLMFFLIGLSLMAALGVNAGARSALWGLPVTAFGAAYLILYAVAERRGRAV
jgi:hypothetical protein